MKMTFIASWEIHPVYILLHVRVGAIVKMTFIASWAELIASWEIHSIYILLLVRVGAIVKMTLFASWEIVAPTIVVFLSLSFVEGQC